MTEVPLPIACALSDADYAERVARLRTGVMAHVVASGDVDGGMTFRFPYTMGLAQDIVSMIGLERECCPFLQFQLEFARGLGDFHLRITGPDGARDFIAATFVHDQSESS